MVVEHTFVTTLPAMDSLNRSREFLSQFGFTEGAKGFAVVNDQSPVSSLDMKRSLKKRGTVRRIIDLPQQLLLQWDRGRVTLAASITNTMVVRTFSFGPVIGRSFSSKRSTKVQAEMMIAMAESLEQLLAEQRPPAEAGMAWSAIEQQIIDRRRREIRRNWIIFAAVILIFGGLIALAIMSQ